MAEAKFDFPDDWVMNSPTEKYFKKRETEREKRPQVWVRMNSKSRRMDEDSKVSLSLQIK